VAVTSGQVTVPVGGTVLARLPAGPASVTISNSGPSPMYVGANSGTVGTLSPTSGMPVPSGGIFTFQLFAGSPGVNLLAVAPGTASTAGFLIATSYGLPQPGVD
jgi:hypothetical protein